ncbi:MAG TPA: DUF481 domain-containing protein [Bryobacteraceae bacterium]|nr:DUF481 domain-containing protein [Bryobacteraceae bacterium]
MRPIALLCLTIAFTAAAQTPPSPPPDTLVLKDGEKLIGHLVRSTDTSVRFASDVLGDVTVDWSKVQELQSSSQYAVIPKSVTLGRKPDVSGVPKGTVSVADDKVTVGGAAPQTMALTNVAHVISEPAFEKAITGQPGFFHAWHGSITAGAAIVQATQDSQSYTGSIALVRAVPAEDWLARRNRTTLDFSETYGLVSQPGTPSVKTSLLHGDLERDEYLTRSVYVFAAGAWDHNYSQGLILQQTYGGGFGWSVLHQPKRSLDLKVAGTYVRQEFYTMTRDLGSILFDEKYSQIFAHGITFTQEALVLPSLTDTKALSAMGSAGLAVPAYKRLSLNFNVVDNWLNDPAVGFKKNSLAFTTGLTYVLP